MLALSLPVCKPPEAVSRTPRLLSELTVFLVACEPPVVLCILELGLNRSGL